MVMTRKITQRTRYLAAIAVLRKLREKRKLNQVEVGKALGRYAVYISKIEKGERRVDIIELIDLLDFYGVSLPKFRKLLETCDLKLKKNGK